MSNPIETTDHPFNEPCYFGEEDEALVVRGDIPAEEAAQRMVAFHEEWREESLTVPVNELVKMKAYYQDNGEDEMWSTWPVDSVIQMPRNAKRICDVWVFVRP